MSPAIRDKKRLANFLSIMAFLIGLLLLLSGRPALAASGTNQQLGFSGKITKADNTNIPDGTYNVEFKIYQDGDNQGTGSTLMWTEDWLVSGSSGVPSTGGISLSGGTFQVNLGSVCGLSGGSCGAKTNTGVDFNQQTLWLSIQIGNSSACTVTSAATSFNTACGGDGEMKPFIRLTATPQALNADRLDGLDSSSFVQLGGAQSGNINIGTGAVTAAGIDSGSAAASLGIGTTNAGTITMGNITNSSFLFKTKSSATAIQVQNGSGFSVLVVDTSANHLKVYDGTATQGYVDIYYDDGNSTGVITSSSGTTTIGSGTGPVTINAGAASAVNITGHAQSALQTDSGNLILQAGSGTISLGTSTVLTATGSLNVQSTGTATWQTTSGNLSITAGSALVLGAATGSTITIGGTGSDTGSVTFAATTREPTLNGSARHARTVTLVPEYPGAVMTADGTGNSGTMTSDFCSGSSLRNIPSTSNPCAASEEHNYYTWVTTSQNDYDIWVRWQVPSDFSDFAASSPIKMYGWRSSTTATTTVNLSLYNASGTLCGTTTNVATGTATWTQTTLGGTITASGCSISAGNVVDLRIQLAANNATVRAGELSISYLSKW